MDGDGMNRKRSGLAEKNLRAMQWEESTLGMECATSEVSAPAKVSIRSEMLRAALFLKLSGESYAMEGWTRAEKAYFARAAEAADILGEEPAAAFLSEDGLREAECILAGLSAWKTKRDLRHRTVSQIKDIARSFPPAAKEQSLALLLALYQEKNGKDSFPAQPGEEQKVADFISWAEEVLREYGADASLREALLHFGRWLCGADLQAYCRHFFDLKLLGTGRFREVLRFRSEGETLQEIGAKYGVTRERIRQLERRCVDLLLERAQSSRYPIFGLISVYRDGDRVLRKEEIEETIGKEYGGFLWYLATMRNEKKTGFLLDSAAAHYGEAERAVIVGDADRTDEAEEKRACIEARLRALPEILPVDDLYADMKRLSKEISCEEEVCLLAAENRYGFRGRYACRGRFTKSKMCEEVLRRKFPDGFKVSDKKAIAAFHKEWETCFGEPFDMTDRALIAKISEMGVLCGRGMYIHRDYVRCDPALLEAVYDYVEKNPKRAIPYTEIFTALADIFRGTSVRNRFWLRGVMKLYHAPYASDRDYLFKDRTGNIVYELTRFVAGRGCVEKEEILAAFPGWQDYNISFVTARCPQVIFLGGGRYMHAGRLSVTSSEKEAMREYLQDMLSQGPVVSKALFAKFSEMFPDFMQRNQIQTHRMLFGILQYVLADSFTFSRPYVRLKEE